MAAMSALYRIEKMTSSFALSPSQDERRLESGRLKRLKKEIWI